MTGLLALASLVGCMGAVPPGGSGPRAIQFTDVVVPDGMSLRDDREESYTVEVGTWRSGHLEYRGATSVNAVSSHVLDRMPRHAWQLVSDEAPSGQRRELRFRRGQYTAHYQIERRENSTRMIVDYSTEPPAR